MSKFIKVTLLAVGLIAASAAFSFPTEQTTDTGIVYVTGGVSSPEAKSMRSMAHKYNLYLTFANTQSKFYADVDVTITNANGDTILTVKSDPILLANLPTGEYTVEAKNNCGQTKVVRTHVKSNSTKAILFTWNVKTCP